MMYDNCSFYFIVIKYNKLNAPNGFTREWRRPEDEEGEEGKIILNVNN